MKLIHVFTYELLYIDRLKNMVHKCIQEHNQCATILHQRSFDTKGLAPAPGAAINAFYILRKY